MDYSRASYTLHSVRPSQPIKKKRSKKLPAFMLLCLLIVGVVYYFGEHEVRAIELKNNLHKIQTQRAQLTATWKNVLATKPPDGDVDIAIYDSKDDVTTEYTNAMASTTFDAASIIKLSILETTLWQDQQKGLAGLTSGQLAQAQPMIEASDNDAANNLWFATGGQSTLKAFLKQIGATQSSTASDWGLTQTTAADQLKVINEVAYPGKLLTATSANQANQLLDNVEADQRWGVGSGVPAGVTVRLKNGWLDYGSGWTVNSLGHVQGDGADYTIAVLTNDDSSEQDGINTIQALSSATWQALDTKPLSLFSSM